MLTIRMLTMQDSIYVSAYLAAKVASQWVQTPLSSYPFVFQPRVITEPAFDANSILQYLLPFSLLQLYSG